MNFIHTTISIVLLTFSGLVFAADFLIPESQIDKFEVTYKKIELYNSTTGEWLLLSDQLQSIDIANASPSQIAGLITSDVSLTLGTYTKIRSVINDRFTLKACGVVGAACTDGNASIKGVHRAKTPLANTIPIDHILVFDWRLFTIYLPSGSLSIDNGTALQMETTLTTPLVVNVESNGVLSVDVVWDLHNKFTYDDVKPDISINFVPTSVTLQLL